MFEYIRKHQRLMQILLAIVIVPSFVFVGVAGYNESNGDAGAVATVAGKKITQQEWDEAQRRQIDQARAQMGAQFDQKRCWTSSLPSARWPTLSPRRSCR
jgi:peptidyl-prolyl cis-trans isomerase D